MPKPWTLLLTGVARDKNGAKLQPFFELKNKRVCKLSLKSLIISLNS